jgi:SEC-C motif-containing protein
MSGSTRPTDPTCPCGRAGPFGALPYDRCCGRYLDDAGTPAPDAEALMRSRYTAYALRREDYVLATWDPATRPDRLGIDPGLRWTGLQVLGHRPGDDTATVEFVAAYTDAAGRPGHLHELSRFTRRDGRWQYTSGT